jgi:hypothetical protein
MDRVLLWENSTSENSTHKTFGANLTQKNGISLITVAHASRVDTSTCVTKSTTRPAI